MRLKDDIEHDLRIPIRLRIGGPGSLIVLVDGKPIFSKKQEGRSPNAAEIIRSIRAMMPAPDAGPAH